MYLGDALEGGVGSKNGEDKSVASCIVKGCATCSHALSEIHQQTLE